MKKVLYVPLDDRPANLDDVIVQGSTAGIEVITPDAEDSRNRLDSQMTTSGTKVTSTYSPTFGNTGNIRQFILDHAANVDGFIISIDMLAYGGLIGSRHFRTSAGGDYPNYDEETTYLLDAIRQIKQSYPNKPVYVMDTVMRLATTTYAGGLTFDAYQESRQMMSQPRREETTFNAILEGYDLRPDGTPFGDPVHFDKEQYYNARRHKLKSTYYVLDQLARLGHIDFLAIGVDDAHTEGIQANEIAWVEEYINEWLGGRAGHNPDRAIILPDADGLGHSLLARMTNELLCGDAKHRFAVQYYGPHGSTIINPFEYMSVHDNILHHIDLSGGQYVDRGSYELELIAITEPGEAWKAVNRIRSNGSNRVPTIVIDFTSGGVANETVTGALLNSSYTGRILGYSAWNTAGNKIGMALGMAQARYAFLTTETEESALDAAVNAHGSLLFKRFLKDYYYKAVTIGTIRNESRSRSPYTNVTADQNMWLFNSEPDFAALTTILRDNMQTHTNTLAEKNAFLAGVSETSYNVRQISGKKWSLAPYSRISLPYKNPEFTWGRAFEITVNPNAELMDVGPL